MRNSCKNCIWQQSCTEKEDICNKHLSKFERLSQLHMTVKEWNLFSKEWDEAVRRIRKFKCDKEAKEDKHV